MTKIVISGGAGFIGSHIAEYWNKKNAEVHIIDNLRSGYEHNVSNFQNVVLHKVSITNKDKVFEILKDTQYVFNLAAMVSVPESVQNPYECVDINVNGLLNLLEACKEHSVEKLIHTSSAAVYGDEPTLPKTTDMKPGPKSPYGITKLDGEYYCKMYNEEFGVKTASLRYFNVFGERQDPKSQYAAAIPIFIEKAVNNKNITIYGNGEQTRDFVYVKDIVAANVMAAENKNANDVYNIASGSYITIKELAEKIIELTNSKSKIIFEQERSGDIKHSYACTKATKSELGFETNFDFMESLKATIDYFLKR